MLCTAISDAYATDERSAIHEALARTLGDGQRDWMPTGVYAYWDYDTHEILYLGLATDLVSRFAQHNGLVKHSGGNKTEEIGEYFAGHERLGFTVLVQSKAIAVMETVAGFDAMLGAKASRLVSVGEGQLIEIHKRVHGSWPRWNKTGGSCDGQRWATHADGLLEVLAVRRDSLFSARHALRTVASDLRIRFYEATVHAARLRTVMGELVEPGADMDSGQIQERIVHTMMLRDGRLVADLSASDDEIREWVGRLADAGYQEAEAARYRAKLSEHLEDFSERDRALFDFLDGTVAGGSTHPQTLASRDILHSGYLDQPLILP